MTRIALLVTVLWLVVAPGCGHPTHELDGGVDGGGVDTGCKGDLAGSERQICGMPDATFDSNTCNCQGDP